MSDRVTVAGGPRRAGPRPPPGAAAPPPRPAAPPALLSPVHLAAEHTPAPACQPCGRPVYRGAMLVHPSTDRRYVIATDGQRLAVSTAGPSDAPTLLFVHGYPDNSAVWDAVADELSPDFRIARYDVRGAGRSTAPRDRSGYRIKQLADDLVTVADAVSPGRPVHLVGHDWGSVQSWHAVTAPQNAQRFASYTTISGPDLGHARDWLRTAPDGHDAVRRQLLRSSYIRFFTTPVLPELSWLTGVGELILAGVECRDGRSPAPARRLLRDQLNGLELYRANMGKGAGRPPKRGTDVPVLALAPAHDAFMIPEFQANAGRWASDFRLHALDGGHWSLRSRPRPVAERIRSFVSEIEARATGSENGTPQ
jgi:pimeloyl-ACP methyl ester carboxylesterase